MMQTIAPQLVPSPASSPSKEASIHSLVAHLMAKATSLPCSAAYSAFANLVNSTFRFQVALDVLLPILSGNNTTPALRILAAYILYSLYASYPLSLNPFKSIFLDVFTSERDKARVIAQYGGVCDTEQLVWALWKILKGDGIDLGPYSAAALAASSIPPKLRAAQLQLTLDNDTHLNGNYGIMNGNEHDDQITPKDEAYADHSEGSESDKLANGKMTNSKIISHPTSLMSLLSEAYSRVLTLSEQRSVASLLQDYHSTPLLSPDNLISLILLNPALGHLAVTALITSLSSSEGRDHDVDAYLQALRVLPPSLPSIDVLGRLLREQTYIQDPQTHESLSISEFIRRDVLGPFINNAIVWIENTEKDELEGLVSDDRVSKAVQILCRFYNSLIKMSFVDPASDADTAEMKHFALTHARFEDANVLYRTLVIGSF